MEVVYTALLFLLMSSLNANIADALNCYTCQNIVDPKTCKNVHTCSTNEVCFLEDQGGVYEMGCADNQRCGGVANPGIVGRDVDVRQSSAQCHECCSMDKCNADLCKHANPTQCIDDPSIDCAKLNSLFHVCQDIHQAKLVCPKFCNLCNLVDGSWSDWSSWTQCDVSCGTGTYSRTRQCNNPAPAHGGLDCVGNPSETQPCPLSSCPVHGGWSHWSHWGKCSVSAGVGMESRKRTCSNPKPSDGGQHCFGDSNENRVCVTSDNADGGWSSWGQWEACSVSCDGGFRLRSRTCSNPAPSLYGRYCEGKTEQIQACSRHACKDGHWSSWGHWGSCSRSCDGGIKSRQRTCTNPKPSLMGRYCAGSPEQVTICNNKPCHSGRVAFMATGTSKSVFQRFPTTVYNAGGGYEYTTGKFTCPVPGLYYFSATLTKDADISTDRITCYLYVNAKPKVGTYHDPYSRTEDMSAYSLSLSGTFQLHANDTVYIICSAGALALDSTGDYCSFTGFLLS